MVRLEQVLADLDEVLLGKSVVGLVLRADLCAYLSIKYLVLHLNEYLFELFDFSDSTSLVQIIKKSSSIE